jgi:hypothetical protein
MVSTWEGVFGISEVYGDHQYLTHHLAGLFPQGLAHMSVCLYLLGTLRDCKCQSSLGGGPCVKDGSLLAMGLPSLGPYNSHLCSVLGSEYFPAGTLHSAPTILVLIP